MGTIVFTHFSYIFLSLFLVQEQFEIYKTDVVGRRDNRGRINPGERYWIICTIGIIIKKTRHITVRSRNSHIIKDFVKKTSMWKGILNRKMAWLQ